MSNPFPLLQECSHTLLSEQRASNTRCYNGWVDSLPSLQKSQSGCPVLANFRAMESHSFGELWMVMKVYSKRWAYQEKVTLISKATITTGVLRRYDASDSICCCNHDSLELQYIHIFRFQYIIPLPPPPPAISGHIDKDIHLHLATCDPARSPPFIEIDCL